MSAYLRPIVLVHGLWDSPYLFKRLKKSLEDLGRIVLVPHLPHDYGCVSLRNLAQDLDAYICKQLGKEVAIDLLGFSMGGLISRVWLQQLNGAIRTTRFISVGSPHKGTFTAQIVPRFLFAGIADMKRGSLLLQELNNDLNALRRIECISFFCQLDLMVFPGWQAVLPVGVSSAMPVLTHKGLIRSSYARELLLKELVKVRD